MALAIKHGQVIMVLLDMDIASMAHEQIPARRPPVLIGVITPGPSTITVPIISSGELLFTLLDNIG